MVVWLKEYLFIVSIYFKYLNQEMMDLFNLKISLNHGSDNLSLRHVKINVTKSH